MALNNRQIQTIKSVIIAKFLHASIRLTRII
jgi:hypothetical protein